MDNVTEPAGKYAVALFFTASSVILFSAFKIGNSATSPEFNHGIFPFQKLEFFFGGESSADDAVLHEPCVVEPPKRRSGEIIENDADGGVIAAAIA